MCFSRSPEDLLGRSLLDILQLECAGVVRTASMVGPEDHRGGGCCKGGRSLHTNPGNDVSAVGKRRLMRIIAVGTKRSVTTGGSSGFLPPPPSCTS